MNAEELPLLARVHAELVELDRDGERLDLAERPALAELVELTRHYEAMVFVRPPGQPMDDEVLDGLRRWLEPAGVVAERRPTAAGGPS